MIENGRQKSNTGAQPRIQIKKIKKVSESLLN